jgi:hypothetical protein
MLPNSKELNMKRFILSKVVALLCVAAAATTAQAQLTLPSTLNLHPVPQRAASRPTTRLTLPSTLYRHAAGFTPARTSAVALARPQFAARPSSPASAGTLAGSWMITSLRQFDSFTLSVDSVSGSRFTYHTSLDSRPRLGTYIATTGMVLFSHTDVQGVQRDFHGRLRQNASGRWVLQGSYLGGGGLSASHIFFGERTR